MAESVVELTWNAIINGFEQISTLNSIGGVAFRNTVKAVHKRMFIDSPPTEFPCISVYPISEEYSTDDTNKSVIHIDCIFAVVGYVSSNSDRGENEQSSLSIDSMSLKHDMFRVVSDMALKYVNGGTLEGTITVPRFILNKSIKMTNVADFGSNNIGAFDFRLPVRIQWYAGDLLA